MAEPKNVYWDSCLWIALINEEVGRVDRCRYVIKEARAGNLKIWTSALALAEVFKAPCGGRGVEHSRLPMDKDAEFEQYIEQGFVEVAFVDRDISIEARRLLRTHDPLKKPADAIHLATALIFNIDEFHTFDQANLLPLSGLVKRADAVPLIICEPPQDPAPELDLTLESRMLSDLSPFRWTSLK